jgi:hypothetical protein
MPVRRSRGNGGLSWDSARQRWVASVTVGYTASGKRIFKRARGRTKSEAQRKLKEILRSMRTAWSSAVTGTPSRTRFATGSPSG